METIAKLLGTILLGGDDSSKVQKLKDGILWMVLGIAVTIGAIWYLVDEDEEDQENTIEYVHETNDVA